MWRGPESAPGERERAHKVAEAYIAARGLGPASIVDVDAGAEPPFFAQHFRGGL